MVIFAVIGDGTAMSDSVVVFIVACVTIVALIGITAWWDVKRGHTHDAKYQLPKHTGKR